MLNIQTGPMSGFGTDVVGKWLKRAKRRTATRIRKARMRDWLGIGAPIAGALFLAWAIASSITGDGSQALAEVPASQAPPTTQVPAVVVPVPSSDPLSLTGKILGHVVTVVGEHDKDLIEIHTATNINTKDLKSVQSDVGAVKEIMSKENTELLKSLNASLDRVQKIMARPRTPLTALSAK